ncbi:hypothetical protein FKM82_013441 [Ascaphus truei]
MFPCTFPQELDWTCTLCLEPAQQPQYLEVQFSNLFTLILLGVPLSTFNTPYHNKDNLGEGQGQVPGILLSP